MSRVKEKNVKYNLTSYSNTDYGVAINSSLPTILLYFYRLYSVALC